jgi:hypothetical protein
LVGQHIYFHLNHPIRFVRIVGVVVAIDDINVKYTVLTLDDGSGATIEMKIIRRVPGDLNSENAPSNTHVDNVNVISEFGVFEVIIGQERIEIGTVIKAKGTISEFRAIKQLEMKRVWTVSTTNEEAQAWAEAASFKQKVLSVPWRLTSAEHRKIKDKIKSDKRKVKEREILKRDHEKKREEHRKAKELHMAQREIKLEARRRKEEAMMNAGALM